MSKVDESQKDKESPRAIPATAGYVLTPDQSSASRQKVPTSGVSHSKASVTTAPASNTSPAHNSVEGSHPSAGLAQSPEQQEQ